MDGPSTLNPTKTILLVIPIYGLRTDVGDVNNNPIYFISNILRKTSRTVYHSEVV